MRRPAGLAAALLLLAGCGGDADGPDVTFTIPSGASFSEVADTLAARKLVGARLPFTIYARLRGEDHLVKAGDYVLPAGASWGVILEALTQGRVVTVPITVPEGFRLVQIAERIAELSGTPVDSVQALLERTDPSSLGVPGPTLEGYLFPDTYHFAPGVAPASVVEAMAARYRSMWTPERQAARDSLGLSERDIVTLASIVQAEARRVDEMPAIASVYHNRLREGWLLQADPTVLYALGGPRERLLFAAIDSVAESPYNTYTQPGLPPGPIGAPGERALEAALHPAQEEYYFFVAHPDGSHTFSRTLADHNRAVAEYRRLLDSISRARSSGGG